MLDFSDVCGRVGSVSYPDVYRGLGIMEMRIINNQEDTLKADLVATLRKGARVSIASACFSMYAYQELKKELDEGASLYLHFAHLCEGWAT